MKSNLTQRFRKQTILSKSLMAILFFAMMAIPSAVHAQDPGNDPDVPIDGGLSLLVVGGVVYGLKKARSYKKRTAGEMHRLSENG